MGAGEVEVLFRLRFLLRPLWQVREPVRFLLLRHRLQVGDLSTRVIRSHRINGIRGRIKGITLPPWFNHSLDTLVLEI